MRHGCVSWPTHEVRTCACAVHSRGTQFQPITHPALYVSGISQTLHRSYKSCIQHCTCQASLNLARLLSVLLTQCWWLSDVRSVRSRLHWLRLDCSLTKFADRMLHIHSVISCLSDGLSAFMATFTVAHVIFDSLYFEWIVFVFGLFSSWMP